MRRRKYGNTRITVDGIQFDSKREAARYQELKLLERAGVISFLQRQTKFQLIPDQHAPSNAVYTKGPRKGQRKPGKLLEHECSYIADFCYIQNGETVVEDAKGYRTEVYRIKKKLMLERYGIQIREV
nr:MAG TPA: Endonuclease [Caudoviricetes sp.]